MKILLLDPNLMSSSRVERALREAGHEVFLAANGQSDFGLIIWNFGAPSWTPATIETAISDAKTQFPSAKLVGFCGHREVERWRAAQTAGLEKMFSNDQMLGETVKSVGSLELEV